MVELDDQQVKHLDMVQGVITRMASNSFALKAISVTLTAGVLAYTGALKSPTNVVVLAGFVPVVLFWLLDAQYLRLERFYRNLYDDIRRNNAESPEPFSMNVSRYVQQAKPSDHLLRVAISWSVLGYYRADCVDPAGCRLAGQPTDSYCDGAESFSLSCR